MARLTVFDAVTIFCLSVGTIADAEQWRESSEEFFANDNQATNDGFGVAAGPIPAKLSSLKLLTKMILAGNQLTGERAVFSLMTATT